jgi:heme/copper-type cytochrome/quinol oxidase subunit 4
MKRATVAGYVLGLFIAFTVCPVLSVMAQDSSEETDPDAKPAAAPAPESNTFKHVIGYVLSIAGTFVVIAIVIHTLSKTLKYDQARNALIHLLRSNPNQAELQCTTMPHTFYEAIGASLKAGGMAASTQDAATIASATLPTYDALGAAVLQHWKGLLGKAKLATAAAIGAIILKQGPLTIILAILAVGGLLWLMVYKMEMDRSIFRAKVEVLPEVDRALVEGRYYVAPPQ